MGIFGCGRIWLRFFLPIFAVVSLPAFAADQVHAEFTTAEPGAWIKRDLTPPAAHPESITQPVSYLLHDRQARLSRDGGFEQYKALLQRINNPSGLESAGTVSIEFNPAFEKLTIHAISILRGDRRIDALQPELAKVIQQEQALEMNIYSGTATFVQIVKGLEVGDLLLYEYTISGRNPILGDKFSDLWYLGYTTPTGMVRLRILYPENRRLRLQRHEADKPRERRIDGYRELSWTVARADGVKVGTPVPRWYWPVPFVQLSEYRDWGEVVDWWHAIYSTALGDAFDWPAADPLIESYKAGELSTEEALVRALRLVQTEIRYFGIFVGENSHRPSSPLEVIERRFGDCKDKTVLLIALLRTLGIQAVPALVSTRTAEGIKELLPGSEAFDHVIVKASIGDQTYWLDPTNSHQGESLASLGLPDFGLALTVRPGVKEFEPISRRESQRVATVVSERFVSTEEDTSLEASYQLKGQLAEAYRYALSQAGSADFSESYANLYKGMYAGAFAEGDMLFSDDPHQNVFSMQKSYSLPTAAWQTRERWKVLETYAHSIGNYFSDSGDHSRQHPIAIEYPLEVEHVIRVRDGEIDAAELVGSVDVETATFRYVRNISTDDDELVIRHYYTTRRDHVPVDELDRHYAASRRVRENLQVNIPKESASWQDVKTREDELKKRLRKMLGGGQ